MKLSIFTCASEKFFPLLRGMLESLSIQLAKNIKRVDAFDITIFSDGLGHHQSLPNKIQVIEARNEDILPYYPSFKSANTSSPFFYLIRPLLPKYTQADIIMWIDADVWFQNEKALEDMVWASNFEAVAAVPETGRLASYKHPDHYTVLPSDLFRYFGEDAVLRFSTFPILNDGFFAAQANSPLWELWRSDMNKALDNVDGVLHFGIDQTTFNYTIYNNDLQFIPLPFTHNCSAMITIPVIIEDKLCFGTVPFEEISAFHLTGEKAKWHSQNVKVLNKEGEYIKTINMVLDYKSVNAYLKYLSASQEFFE